MSSHLNVLRNFAFFLGVGERFDFLLVLLRRLAASEKFVRDAQTPGGAKDFQIVKLLLY